ncbi:winged helix-turn-helix domain-containing protein [Duganella sp. Dugasp56]|uniref:winged helix-turn-helix domain-containing protein n=1 Tax=Duganella sp. Dugasp56 TaxID=3243046 RepID=UPI0033636AC5
MRCLVIEDEAETSNYICKGLREAGYLVTSCDNGPEGLDLAVGDDWDVIILDRMLPGRVDGLTIVDKLRALGKATPVIIVSAMTTIDARVSGLRGGADDYLSKPFAFSELLARVEALLRRSAPGADSSQLQVADLKLDLRTLRVTRGSKVITLQPREYRLLEYLMRNVNQVVTRTMLLESVWDYHFDPQTNVIDVQISRLRAKVDKDFPVMLIHTLRGVGYRMGAAPPEDGTERGLA